jgi:hypothetical protein
MRFGQGIQLSTGVDNLNIRSSATRQFLHWLSFGIMAFSVK